METFDIKTVICLLFLITLHLFAFKMRSIDFISQGRLLSAAGGVSIAYVFIDLLPKFCQGAKTVDQVLGVFPYLERHVYILALLGLLFTYTVQRATDNPDPERAYAKFWIQICTYSLFNFMIGYSLSNENNPDIRPILLFAIAMGLHYLINDHNLYESNAELYDRGGRWVISFGLLFGWALGLLYDIPEAATALLLAFLSGGIMMNVFRHEIPTDNPRNYSSFIFGAITYAVILLSIGR
jgi:hypothetical protein